MYKCTECISYAKICRIFKVDILQLLIDKTNFLLSYSLLVVSIEKINLHFVVYLLEFVSFSSFIYILIFINNGFFLLVDAKL